MLAQRTREHAHLAEPGAVVDRDGGEGDGHPGQDRTRCHLATIVRLTSVDVTPAEAPRPAAAGEPAIVVDGVGKTFRLPHQQYSTLKERVLHPLRSQAYDELRALDDVSFTINKGEFFGIVGRNGSGKSTLLKCLAGIYDLDRGDIRIEGRLSPFIELGVGFNPDLTARDNVIINAIMLGMSRKTARERFDAVVEFAELEDFLDLKLKNYSSGMNVRLAFATAIQVDAELLLVDEVLAVGDAAFQQKCFEEFQRMKDAGRTIVFVTHDMAAVERFCDRAMLLEKGRMVDIGDPRAISRAYNELNFGRVADDLDEEQEAGRYGDRRIAEVSRAWFENVNGEPIVTVGQGEQLRACFEVVVHEQLDDPVFAVTLRNEAHHTILVERTDWRHGATGDFTPGQRAVITFQFDTWLAPSRYTASPSIARAGTGESWLDVREDLASIVVHGQQTGGVVDLPHQVEITRV
jgi:ABC-type polysaccharide/polyol phosphate transport system ATPase subunit